MTSTPVTTYLKDYIACDFSVESLHLTFDLLAGGCTVTSVMQLIRIGESQQDIFLHGEALEFVSAKIDGVLLAPAAYRVEDKGLTIFNPGNKFILEIVNRNYPDKNTALAGLYRSSAMLSTQCEAHGFRRIAYYFDRPDVLTHFTTKIIADKKSCPVLLSNGNLIETGELANNRHYAVWDDPFKKPCYLFALVAGDLAHIEDEFVTCTGRKIKLQLFTEPAQIGKCQHAMDSLKHAMRWDEEKYGREYDLDIFMIVAVGDFNMGAMENKGLNIFNTQFILADPQTATDQDYVNIESVVGHEYFHNWTGNRITCRDWFQLSLKEGLTVFRDQEFSADLNHRALCRIQDVRVLRNAQFPEDAGPMAHPVRPESYIEMNNFYTATVYNKGAEVIRMMHTLAGADNYRKGTDLYFERFDGMAVTIEDFAKAIEDGAGLDLSQFRYWYSQAGTPVVKVAQHYDANKKTYSLTLRQHCPDTPGQTNKKPFLIPVKMSLLSAAGDCLPLQLAGEQKAIDDNQRVLQFSTAEQTFEFINVATKPIPSLLQNFSAPVIVEVHYTEAELLTLIAHDPDLFNRFEACQRLAMGLILSRAEQGADSANHQPLVTALHSLFEDSKVEPAFVAECMSLPSIMDLARDLDEINIDALAASRRALMRDIATSLESVLMTTYQGLIESKEYQPSPAQVGLRSLKNIVLNYLCQADSGHAALAEKQYRDANNMTTALGALRALAGTQCAAKVNCLADFYEKWQHEDLVVNKWFSLQATADAKHVLDDVLALQSHAAFTLKNPNRARSLIAAFCSLNLPAFHDVSGRGYVFLADNVIALNSINPQIAARLVSNFNQWHRYDLTRQALMKAQLERIAQTKDLSNDVYEIVSKALAFKG